MTPKDRAEKASAAMAANDDAAQWMGMTIDHIDEGAAVMGLTIQPHHTNGHNICHGGIIFSLADTAFAHACNSRNQSTVAQHNMINFVAPAMAGDHLTATATEISLTGRSGIYDVRVTNQNGATIAVMRGMSRAIKGQLFAEGEED